MSQTPPTAIPAETRGGSRRTLGAFVVAAAFDRAGSVAAFALGDGTLRLVEPATGRLAQRRGA